jgi:hypothetical protein
LRNAVRAVAGRASLGQRLAGLNIRSVRAPAAGSERGRRAERDQKTVSVHQKP